MANVGTCGPTCTDCLPIRRQPLIVLGRLADSLRTGGNVLAFVPHATDLDEDLGPDELRAVAAQATAAAEWLEAQR